MEQQALSIRVIRKEITLELECDLAAVIAFLRPQFIFKAIPIAAKICLYPMESILGQEPCQKLDRL